MKPVIIVAAVLAAFTARSDQAALTGAEIPDGKAFHLFISGLARGIEENGAHHLVDVLDLDHEDPHALQAAQRLAPQFLHLNEGYQREYRQTEYEILCRLGSGATDKDRYRALDSLWEARGAVGTKYYQIMVARIDGEFADLVMNYFNKRKNGMAISAPEPHRPAYQAAGIDPAEMIENACSSLEEGGAK